MESKPANPHAKPGVPTPGPWGRNIAPVDRYPIIFGGPMNQHVARVLTQRIPYAEAEANANLIAAAPSLLKAAKDFLDSNVDTETAVDQALAAIALAEAPVGPRSKSFDWYTGRTCGADDQVLNIDVFPVGNVDDDGFYLGRVVFNDELNAVTGVVEMLFHADDPMHIIAKRVVSAYNRCDYALHASTPAPTPKEKP